MTGGQSALVIFGWVDTVQPQDLGQELGVGALWGFVKDEDTYSGAEDEVEPVTYFELEDFVENIFCGSWRLTSLW
jgi:hypothetical protein